ncbi:hypothetical protein FACS189454_09050 [Planctomycetales bacterium]|nr:hypothetical protein FACS189454_09050 [Planctomycetales bacterium]
MDSVYRKNSPVGASTEKHIPFRNIFVLDGKYGKEYVPSDCRFNGESTEQGIKDIEIAAVHKKLDGTSETDND